MKTFAVLLTFIALSAHAEVIINGGFGTDGASGESIPLARSVKDAAEIYKALDVKPDARDKKIISISDESNFECEKPFSGMVRFNAGCMFILRASQNGKLVRGKGLSGTVTFTGKLATKIFNALPADTSGRVGASTKTVANLSCSKVVRPGIEATCTIKDTNALDLNIKI